MLHAENLFEIVSFFALYDLDALLMTSRELCQHASKCAEKIPTWYFASVEINFWDEMAVLEADSKPSIFITGKRNIVEALNIALQNSIIGDLHLYCNSQSTLVHSLIPTNAALMVETLHLCTQDFNGATHLVDFLGRFRTIKAIAMYGRDDGANFEPVVNYCRQRSVESIIDKYDAPTIAHTSTRNPRLPDVIGLYSHDQLFFMNFAQVWCQMTPTPEQFQAQILRDPHSPSAYRVPRNDQELPRIPHGVQLSSGHALSVC